jgi:hypothetical protein
MAAHAVIVGCGRAEVAAAVLGAITVLGAGTALVLRNSPRGSDVGAGSFTAGLLTAPPAVWLALFAADVPVTARVRVSLAVAVLLCLVAHTVSRQIPGYGPHALGVALLAASTAPIWALPGNDPAVLYAAAGLLLVVALLPLPGARGGGAFVAALLPGVALLVLTATDLAVVLLEPWTALDGIWSGVPPVQSPVAWPGIIALAGAAVAAAAAGWHVTRSPLPAAPPAKTATGPAAAGSSGSVPAATATGTAPADNSEAAPAETATEAARADNNGAIPAETATGTAPADNSEAAPAETATEAARADNSEAAPAETATGTAPANDSGAVPAATGAAPADGSGSAPAASSVPPPGLVAGWAAAPFVAVIIPLVFAAAGAAWPAVPIAALVAGLAGLLAVVLAPVRYPVGNLLAVLFGAMAAAGVAGSAAGHGATIAALGLVVAASVTAGLLGRLRSDRVAGWTAGSTSVVVLSYTIADLIDLGLAGPPLFVLGAAASVIGLEWVLSTRRPVEARSPFVVGHASALVALLITDSPGWAALVCKLWALVLTVRALRPGETRRTRFRYAIAAGSTGLAGWWFLLSSRDVETVEIYTLPAAVLAVIAGWFARRGRPELPSWTAYGPALAAAFLPTLAVIANSTADEPHYLRRLLLGAGALLVLLAGARARLQAPVVTGGGTLLLVALHELVQFWDLLPRWAPLAVGGLLLVGIATTMEQRRRDLARLRAAITRMA